MTFFSRGSRYRPLTALFLFFTAIPAGAWCDTIHVPGDYQTIQAAIHGAGFQGDTVLVAAGTYPANIIFTGKDYYWD